MEGEGDQHNVVPINVCHITNALQDSGNKPVINFNQRTCHSSQVRLNHPTNRCHSHLLAGSQDELPSTSTDKLTSVGLLLMLGIR